jgi:hypothetical protein
MKPLSFSSKTMFSLGSLLWFFAAFCISINSFGDFPAHLENFERKACSDS